MCMLWWGGDGGVRVKRRPAAEWATPTPTQSAAPLHHDDPPRIKSCLCVLLDNDGGVCASVYHGYYCFFDFVLRTCLPASLTD